MGLRVGVGMRPPGTAAMQFSPQRRLMALALTARLLLHHLAPPHKPAKTRAASSLCCPRGSPAELTVICRAARSDLSAMYGAAMIGNHSVLWEPAVIFVWEPAVIRPGAKQCCSPGITALLWRSTLAPCKITASLSLSLSLSHLQYDQHRRAAVNGQSSLPPATTTDY